MQQQKEDQNMAISDKRIIMKEIIESMDYMVRVMDADHKVIYI